MNDSTIRTAVEKYADMIYRICIVMLKNDADAEDAVQETFLKYVQKSSAFECEEHEKAWFITTATNKCRDMLRFRNRHSAESENSLMNYSTDSESSYILDALMEIPDKYREILVLHYVEGYKVEEIAKHIGKTASAVKMRLSKARKLLEEKYRKEYL